MALRTRSSTDEIREILGRLQLGAADVTAAPHQRTNEARQTTRQAQTARRALEAIGAAVGSITDRGK